MNRVEFMNQLENLLSGITPSEREEAIKYYNDYFEDAGAENEASVIDELVSPEKVAETIQEGLGIKSETTENRGFNQSNDQQSFNQQSFNQQGFGQQNFQGAPQQGFGQQSFQGASQQGYGQPNNFNNYNQTNGYPQGNPNNMNNQGPRPMSTGSMILLIILIFITSPVWISVLAAMFALICAFFGLIAGFGAASIGLAFAGVVLFGFGVVKCFIIPVGGICLLGVALLLVMLAALFGLAAYGCVKLIVLMTRGIVALCRLPFRRTGGCMA